MEDVVLMKALSEATAGLSEVTNEFRALEIRKEQLEAIVKCLSDYLEPKSAAEQTNSPTVNSLELSASTELRSTWMIARDVLRAAGRPLTVSEIHRIAASDGSVTPTKDALRIAMMRKPGIFTSANGAYFLNEGERFNAQEATEAAS